MAKSKISAGFVKQVGWIGLQTGKSFINDYSSNITQFAEDAKSVLSDLKQGKTKVVDAVNDIKANGGKKINDWFFSRSEETDGFDFTDNSDSDFDAGFQVGDSESGDGDVDQTPSKVLDEDSMKNIAGGQINAMYQIGAKQAEASMINAASISTTIDKGVASIVTAVNNVNSSIAAIGEKLDMITRVVVSQQEQEESQAAKETGMFDSNGRVTLGSWWNHVKNQANGGLDTLRTYAPMLIGSPAELLKELIDMTGFRDKNLGTGIRNIANKFNINENEDRFINRLAEKLKGETINTVGNDINAGVGDFVHNFLGGNMMPKSLSNALDSIPLFGGFIKDMINGSTGVRRSKVLEEGSSASSEYNRDTAKFDNMVRTSIVEIIPDYLKIIAKGVTGKEYNVSIAGHVTSQTKEERQREIDSLTNFSENNGGVFTNTLSDSITKSFNANNSRGKGYQIGNMGQSIDDAFKEFPLDTARDQFGVLAAFYFGDKIQEVATFNNQLDDKFWNYLKDNFPQQMATATGNKAYGNGGAKRWMCIYYIDTVKNQLMGAKKGVITGRNSEITSFLANINQKANNIIESNNAAAAIAESFGRGDEHKKVSALSYAQKYHDDESSRNKQKEIDDIKEGIYKQVKQEILQQRKKSDDDFDELVRESYSSKIKGAELNSIKKDIDEAYQKRLLTEKRSINIDTKDPTSVITDTISNIEKKFEKSLEDASQVRTKEFDFDERMGFPKFANKVVELLTDIRNNTSKKKSKNQPDNGTWNILNTTGSGNVPPLYNIWGSGDKSSEEMEDDKMADALNMGAQAKLNDDKRFDNKDASLIQQLGSKLHNSKLGTGIAQFWRRLGVSNNQVENQREASGEDKSGGGLSSLFKGGILGFITKGAGTILKGVGSAIINVIAKPILKFMLKGFKSGFNDITSGVKTLFGLGGESDEEAKKNALTVTIPEKIEKIFGFLTNKQQREDAREAAKVEKEKKKEEEKKAKEQKKQEAEERKVKKQYDKMQGMTEEQRTRLQQQWEHAANNENASEATRKKAQEKLALINAANKFDNDAYEQRQAQQKYERTRDRLQAYRDDETKSQEFRDRARTRLRQVNAENYGSNFQNALQSRQAYQEKRLAEFGEKINKVIPGFTKFANKMVAAGNKIWSGASSVVKGLGKAVLHPLKSFGKAITTVRDTVKKGFNGLVENIKQGGLNILEAGKAIKKQAAENGGGIKGWSKTLTAAAGVGIGKVTSFLSGHKNETEDEKIARKEKSREALGKVGNVLGGTGKILLGISKMVMTAVMSMTAIKTLITSIKNVFNKSMKKLEPAVTKIVKIIQPLVSKIGDTVSKLAEGLSKMVTSMQGVFKVLVNSIGKVLDSLMTALEPVMEAVIRFATPLQSLIEGLMPVVEVLLDVGGSLLTQFIDMTTGFVTSLLPLVDTVICPAIQTIAGVIQVIAGGIQSLIGVVESGLGHVVEAIGNLAEFFTKDDSLAETGRSLQKAGLEAMEGGVEQVERGKQTIKDAWSGGSKVNEPTTDDTDDSSSTTYESKLPTLNASTGASVDTYASGDESTATSNGVEFDGTSVYGELGGMLESIGVLLNNIAVPLNEDIVPLIKNQWTIYQEPLLTAINNTYKNLLKPQYELVGKIAGKQVEIADDILTPTMVTQEVDIKNDLEESVAQQKMTQGIIQNIGGNLLAANGLLLAAAGQTAAGNMLYQTAAGLSAQGMTTTTSGIQQYVNNNSQLLTGKYFNLSQLYPDDPYEGYSTTATTKESATTNTPTEEVTTQPTTQSIPQVQSSSEQYREFYERGGYASGDSQGSFGSYLNMSQRGCGPVALADAANRRGGHINAGTLAGSMASSGRYSSSRGTSVGGFLDTAASLGMGYQAGGVTAGSLKRASANNPITLVGSGAGFGTRSGNTHFINVVGTDNSGGAYVSNPLSGRVERRSANDLVSGSVLGLYGSGDITMTPGGLYDLYGAGDTFSLTSAKNILESASTATLNGQNVGNYLAALYRNWNKYYEYTHPDIEVYYNSSLTKDQLTSNSSVANWFKNYLNNYSGLSYWSTSKTVYQKIIDDAAEYAQLVTTYKKISEAEAARKASTNSSSISATSSETSTTTSSTTTTLNRNKNTTASGTITSAEAAKWLSKIRGSAAGSAGLSDAIDRAYKEYNQKESTHNKTGADTYNLNMWWWKASLIYWDQFYEEYNKSLSGNSTHLTFANWYKGLSENGLNSEKGVRWQRVANGITAGNDPISADIDTIEAEEASEYLASSGISSTATTGEQAWSLATNPGGFTGYVSTEAKYTPGSTSTEAPTTGSSFTDRFKQAMSGLTNIWNNIMGIFSLSDKSDAEQAIEDAEEDKKEKKIRAEIGNEEYEQYEDLAWQAYMEANPQAQGESDATYQTRLKNGWTDKVKQKWMNKLAGEQANMIDAQRYNSISDVQEGVGSTIYGGYNQETGLWEDGAWSTMGTSGTTNSNTSSYNTTYTGTTQDVISYEGITQDHDVWDVYQQRYADKWPSIIQDAYKNSLTPAEIATILSTSIWEDGAEKIVGIKSLTNTTYDGKGQRADGIMNWVSTDDKGDTVSEQMNYMKRRYFMDTPMDGFEYNGKYRKTNEYDKDIQAFKEMTGRSGYALALDSRYGPNLNTDLVEGSSHFYQLDLAPDKAHTASGLADYVGTAIGAYNWMMQNGYGTSNMSSYDVNSTTEQSQVANTGNEDWTDTEGNKRTIWAYLTNTLGFSKEGAAGAMGNMYAESNYSPYALLNHTLDDYSIEYANKVNSTGKFPSSDPYGIVQWLGSRRDKLLTHAKSSNASIADLSMQLAFLSNELNSDYKDVNSNMKGANDVQTASDYWQQHFEVCGEATNKRRNAAKEAYEQFKNATNLDASSYGTTGSTTTDLNNTLWINTLNRVIHETDVEGIHDYSQSSHPITLDGKTLSGRPDCTGMFKYAIDYLGYDTDNIQSDTLVSSASSSNHPISKDGQPSEDFTAYSYSEVGKEGIRPGDILVEPGHGEVGYGLVGSSIKGWNFGSDTGIAQTQAAAARMLNGETVQSVMEGDNIQNMSTPTYVIRPSGQLTVPVAGSASTGSSGIAGGVGMNIGKFNTALNSTAGRYGQTGSYRNSYSKTSSFGNYAFGAMGGYANFVSPEMVSVSSYSGNSGATSTMISGTGTLPAGKGINITGVTATAPAKSSAVAGMSSSGLATQMNVPASQKDRIRKRSGKPTKVTWHTWADDGGSTDPQILTDWWDSRECSVNYGISDNGVIKQEIDEGYGAWTSSSPSNDSQAVTLEIANSSGARSMGEEWPISDAAMQSAINLTYDIAKRNGISQFNFTRKAAKPYKNEDGADGNWTYHRMFAQKSCPGDYIYDRTNDILNVINGALANTSATAQNSSLVNSITAAGDIPDIDMSKVSAVTGVDNGSSTWNDYDNGILNSELFDETKANTTNIIVNRVESDQNTMMDRILEHTFNVRAVQVEELLETIIEKMDHMATTKNEQPVTATVTQNQSSLFPSDDIPKQVQRLAQG